MVTARVFENKSNGQFFVSLPKKKLKELAIAIKNGKKPKFMDINEKDLRY